MRPPADEIRNPALDEFRNRGGRVWDENGRSGIAYVSTDTWWATRRWWWRPRFVRPEELPHLWIDLGDDGFNDYVLPSEHIPDLVADWSAGRLGTWNGLTLDVEWADPAASKSIRVELGIPMS